MRTGLSPDDLGDLLEQPLVAVLATYRASGEVLLSPVWHRWRDGGFDVVVFAEDIKVKHLGRDPRASILVYEHVPPYRGLELRGEAQVLEAGGGEALLDMGIRYLGPEDGRAYAESAAGTPTVVVRLEPGVIRAWEVG